jgi:hypothetical protein
MEHGAIMAGNDKTVKTMAGTERKASGLSYTERQPLAAKIQGLEDQLNAAMGGDFSLDFMKKYCVLPTGKGHVRTVTGTDARGTAFTGQALDTDHQQASTTQANITFGEYTSGQKKVAYGHLVKRPGEGSKFELVVETTQKNQSFPIYYLPWSSDQVLRLSLPQKGQGPHGVPDPDVFFTAAINGCSVFIEENGHGRRAPTIYHGGTENNLGTNSGKYWRDLFIEWTANTDAKGAKSYSEVKSSQYVSAISKTGQAQHDKQTGTSLDYRTWLQGKQKDLDVQVVQPWGCVFGLRDPNGDWTFYLQKNATVTYYTFNRSFPVVGARKQSGTIKTANIPMQLTQIFPGRPHVRLTEFTKVKTGLS